ncbi:hypothetical protein GCM10028819_14020 [Spirosoma humi]
MTIHFSQRGNRWDSLLFPIEDNRFELTLQFRIRLVRIEPTSSYTDTNTYAKGDGNLQYVDGHQTIKLEPWNDLEWEIYKREFKQVLERNWGERFVLTANKAWYTPRAGSAPINALIKCSLAIQVVDFADQQPHFLFRCIHFHPATYPDHFRSYVSNYYGLGVITHEDTNIIWAPQRTNKPNGIIFGQIPIVHEFGHILGFDHINGDGNDESAYGVTIDQQNNVMGIGYLFADKQAEPWERAMNRHLVRENRYDQSVKFTGHVDGPQIAAYWDDNWVSTPDPSPAIVPIDDAVQGLAGVTWKHMTNLPNR